MVRKRGPPLTKFLPIGAGQDFAAICKYVLKMETQIRGYRFEPFNDSSGDPFGLDSISHPGSNKRNFEGQDAKVGFAFVFKEKSASDLWTKIAEDINKANRCHSDNNISLLIIILPEDLQIEKITKYYKKISSMKVPFKVQFYGHKDLFPLFIKYPEMVSDYYPQLIDKNPHQSNQFRSPENFLSLMGEWDGKIKFGKNILKPYMKKIALSIQVYFNEDGWNNLSEENIVYWVDEFKKFNNMYPSTHEAITAYMKFWFIEGTCPFLQV